MASDQRGSAVPLPLRVFAEIAVILVVVGLAAGWYSKPKAAKAANAPGATTTTRHSTPPASENGKGTTQTTEAPLKQGVALWTIQSRNGDDVTIVPTNGVDVLVAPLVQPTGKTCQPNDIAANVKGGTIDVAVKEPIYNDEKIAPPHLKATADTKCNIVINNKAGRTNAWKVIDTAVKRDGAHLYLSRPVDVTMPKLASGLCKDAKQGTRLQIAYKKDEDSIDSAAKPTVTIGPSADLGSGFTPC